MTLSHLLYCVFVFQTCMAVMYLPKHIRSESLPGKLTELESSCFIVIVVVRLDPDMYVG
jgi:hypothetical protein